MSDYLSGNEECLKALHSFVTESVTLDLCLGKMVVILSWCFSISEKIMKYDKKNKEY
jgi:hypothetical protein